MIVSLIVAMDEQGGIAQHGRLPWHLPAELKLFKQTTMGHHLLMGRKTFESVGKPLPGRTTIVITHQEDYQPEGCLVTHSLEAGLAIAQARGEREIFVCGGGEIYIQVLPLVDRIYLTVVHTVASTDMIFPPYDPSSWQEITAIYHPVDEKNPLAFTRKVLEKKKVTKVSNKSVTNKRGLYYFALTGVNKRLTNHNFQVKYRSHQNKPKWRNWQTR